VVSKLYFENMLQIVNLTNVASDPITEAEQEALSIVLTEHLFLYNTLLTLVANVSNINLIENVEPENQEFITASKNYTEKISDFAIDATGCGEYFSDPKAIDDAIYLISLFSEISNRP
jgi:hypothetical protein